MLMEVDNIKNYGLKILNSKSGSPYNKSFKVSKGVIRPYVALNNTAKKNVSFGINISSVPKSILNYVKVKSKLILKTFSNYMKDISETTNAGVTMIGTGVVAPIAIMCSPKKPCKDKRPGNDEAEKEKKLFQAIRQPISAALAFAFQMVTIFAVNKTLNHGAYKSHWGMFKDEHLGDLIPDDKYLQSQARKALAPDAPDALKTEWAEEIRLTENEAQLKAKLKEKIRADYEDVGASIKDKDLDAKVSSKRKIEKFRLQQMALEKEKKLKALKLEELKSNPPENLDIKLITEDQFKTVKETFASELSEMEKNANLSWTEKLLRKIGIKSQKVKALETARTAFIQREGLELVKKDMGSAFFNQTAKLERFIQIKTPDAQRMFKNKLFWASLGPNLIMVALSCVALNWLHPKLAKIIDKIRGKDIDKTHPEEKKVEVSKCR